MNPSPHARRQQFQDAVREVDPSLRRLLAGWERNPERRDELRQEIFTALWQALANFRGDASLKTYALRIAHNTATRHITRAVRSPDEPLASLEELAAEPPTVEHDLDASTRRAALMNAVHRLKPRDRQLTLLWLEDCPVEEVAQITGLTPTYIHTLNHRIRQVLARRLGAENV